MSSGSVNYQNMNKINIIGSGGSGKSTFAKHLAYALHLPHLEMDSLYWLPNWEESSQELFFAKLKHVLEKNKNGWVLDGSYSRSIPIKWQEVDTVIWLNYSFTRTMFQLTKRTILRSLDKTELWEGTGNKESLKNSFFSKKSIIWWVINNYYPQQKKNQAFIQAEKFKHIQFIELTSPKAAKIFLEKI